MTSRVDGGRSSTSIDLHLTEQGQIARREEDAKASAIQIEPNILSSNHLKGFHKLPNDAQKDQYLEKVNALIADSSKYQELAQKFTNTNPLCCKDFYDHLRQPSSARFLNTDIHKLLFSIFNNLNLNAIDKMEIIHFEYFLDEQTRGLQFRTREMLNTGLLQQLLTHENKKGLDLFLEILREDAAKKESVVVGGIRTSGSSLSRFLCK